MASFDSVLANIPGYGGYLAKQRFNQDAQENELQNMLRGASLIKLADQYRAENQARMILANEPIETALPKLLQNPLTAEYGLKLATAQQAIATRNAQEANARQLANLHAEQVIKQRQDAIEAQRRAAATSALSGLLAPAQGPEGSGAMQLTSAVGEDKALQEVMQAEREGRQANVKAVDPGIVQGLSLQIDPKDAVKELMKVGRPDKPLTPRQQLIPVAGGYIEMDENGRPKFTRTEQKSFPAEPPVQTYTDNEGNFYERERGGSWKLAIGPNGQPIKGTPKVDPNVRIDLSAARQLQGEYNRFVKPSQDNLFSVAAYRQIRDSGDTAQAASMAADALRRSARSNDRALKGETERLLGGGYGGGSLVDRVENYISRQLAGSPSDTVLKRLDTLIDATERANVQQIALQTKIFAGRANSRNLKVQHVTGAPGVYGRYTVFPDGKWATFNTPQEAEVAAQEWLKANP